MTITEADVRAAINIPEASELSAVAIASAITRAASYITVLQYRYSAPAEFFPTAESAFAIFLAYQAYADRVLNVVPGSYEEGKWSPIAEEIVRATGDKLAGLRQVADDLIGIIKSYPTKPTGTFHHSTPATAKFSIGQFDYPSDNDY